MAFWDDEEQDGDASSPAILNAPPNQLPPPFYGKAPEYDNSNPFPGPVGDFRDAVNNTRRGLGLEPLAEEPAYDPTADQFDFIANPNPDSRYMNPAFATNDPTANHPAGVQGTKLGKFLDILQSVTRGAMAGQAAAERSVVASGGHSSGGFGTGYMGAVQDAQQRQRLQMQQQAMQTQMQQRQAQAAYTQARANEYPADPRRGATRWQHTRTGGMPKRLRPAMKSGQRLLMVLATSTA